MEIEGKCFDIEMPRVPRPEHDCEWFEENPKLRCNDTTVNETIMTSSGHKKQARDFCCACGRGSKINECQDYPDWKDSHPTEPYECKLYTEKEECFNSGNDYINFGHSANTACCACGKILNLTFLHVLIGTYF